MAALSSISPQEQILPATRVFREVIQEKDISTLRNIFETVLQPIYGPQEDAINKIRQRKDRISFLLYEKEMPVGVLVFKTVLSNEFKEFKIKDSIEIKSLFVVNSTQNSGRGLGTILLNKVFEEANQRSLNYENVHVTVNVNKPQSILFFLNKGFTINHTWRNKYQKGDAEHLLSYPVKINSLAQDLLKPSFTRTNSQPTEEKREESARSFASRLVYQIANAHWDDIHSLEKLSDGTNGIEEIGATFVSGSKDGSIRKWNEYGDLVRTVLDFEPLGIDERHWITTIKKLNSAYWLSGARTGQVQLWTTEGDYVKPLRLQWPKSTHISKQFNQHRVNCLAPSINTEKFEFFAGFPTLFDEYNIISDRNISSTFVHKNDWVYCIHPLTEKRILAVVAASLEVWEKTTPYAWQKNQALIQEQQKTTQHKARPHISCLLPLGASEKLFSLGDFDGSIKVIDIEQNKTLHTWREHKNKVWALQNISPHIFASGSDDRSIKFWDVRQAKRVDSSSDFKGGVSTLLNLEEQLLVAGSNPPDSYKGAELHFLDLRK